MKILHNRQAEYALEQKLRAYFKLPKDVLERKVAYELRGAEEVCPVVSYEVKDDDFTGSLLEKFYCVQCSKLNLAQLFEWDKLVETGLYEAFEHGEGFVPEAERGGYRLVVYLVGKVWVMFRTYAYSGSGGIYLSSNTKNGLVMQPIKNYLRDQHPLGE